MIDISIDDANSTKWKIDIFTHIHTMMIFTAHITIIAYSTGHCTLQCLLKGI